MLALGSRAAQRRASHCRARFRPASTSATTPAGTVTTNPAARRVTTSRASNPRRRKILASDVFTACYTAIMATAAVLDANRKDRRRRDLDHEIAQAKSSLADMLERSNARDLAQVVMTPCPDVPDARSTDMLDIFEALCAMPADRLQDRIRGRRGRLVAVHRLRKMLGVHWVMDPPQGNTSTLSACEAMVIAEGHGMDPAGREPKEDTHMSKIAAMVVDLVERLMSAAWTATEAQEPTSHGAIHSPDSPATMLRMLMSEGYPAFASPHLNPAGTVEQRTRLNDFGFKIMNEWMERHREPYAAKICHNLLVCGVPPSIQNYNLLILGFAMLGEHALAQAVVDSFLYMSHLKPTEATCLCLLHHYRLKGDVVGFQRMIKRMVGYDPRGIGLRRREAWRVERTFGTGRPTEQWATGPDIVVHKGFYVQQAPFTLNIAEAMMEGLLDFGLLHESAKILFVCVREGWAISRDLMWRVFNMCLGLFDTTVVKIVVQGLLDNIEQASAMLLHPDGFGPEVSRQLHYILTVWQATTLPEPDNWAMDNSELDALEANRVKLDHLTTAIWLNEACNYSDKMSKCLGIIQRQLSEDDRPWGERIDRALRTLDAAVAHPVAKLRRTERVHRAARLDWLLSQVAAADHKIRDAEKTICNALARQTPRPLRRVSHFGQWVPIDERIARAAPYGTPGRPEHAAAWCFRASKELDARLKEAVWEALPEERVRELGRAQNKSGDVSLEKTLACLEGYLVGLDADKEKGALWADPFAAMLEQLPPDFEFLARKKERRAAQAMGYVPHDQAATAAAAAAQSVGW